jgi:hypothetical protein
MPLDRKFVNAGELQRLFNDADYFGRTQTGEFLEEVVYDRKPHPKSGQASGTRSERVNYTDQEGRYMATVHQFKRIDGSLGASGLPDPKRVRIGNTLYILDESGIPAE